MKILVIEDHPLFREIICEVVRRAFPGAATRAVGSLAEGLAAAQRGAAPALVLLDLCLPDSSGLDTVTAFRRAHPEPRVAVLTALDDPAIARAALAAGAQGYLPKTSPPPIILAALRLVAEGGTYVPPEAIEPAPAAAPRTMALTPRQAEVLRLIARGLSNKAIGRRLGIAEDTVKQHASGAYSVLGVTTRMEAATMIARGGVVLD
jgi:DNA-binding NarL/FixJ family response regulator